MAWKQLKYGIQVGGLLVTPQRGIAAYEYGAKFISDTFFRGGAAQKSYLVYMGGDRLSGKVASGDSNDAILRMDFSNYALNDNNFIMRGINLGVQNRSAGTLNYLESASFTSRQRGDSGAIGLLRGLYLSIIANVGSGAISTTVHGMLVEMQLEANMPSDSAGVVVKNKSDGVYTLPTAAFAAKNNGTSSCKGFSYGLDLYDSAASTCDKAEIRMNSEVCILKGAGVPTNGTTGAAFAGPGSLYIDITNMKLYINGNTKASPTWKIVTSAS